MTDAALLLEMRGIVKSFPGGDRPQGSVLGLIFLRFAVHPAKLEKAGATSRCVSRMDDLDFTCTEGQNRASIVEPAKP